jgi:aldehyde:ferredoxin oxidoreductase
VTVKGFHGKILVVDLTTRTYQVEEPPEETYRKYLGGYGLGAWYIYGHIKPGCDPLGPENILGFTPGLLTGSGAPFTGRYMVCGKSPLTGKGKRSNGEWCSGGWGNANSGGTFGPSIKRAGFDAIFFTGQADKPVYLLITDDRISIEDAGFLWSKDIVETELELAALHGSKAAVAAIGPAGENLSLIAGIANDKGRIAARSGLGAVMGSKRLKALCMVANKKLEFSDRPKMMEITKAYFAKVKGFKESKIVPAIATKLDYFAPIMRLAKMGLSAPSNMLPYVMGGAYGGAAVGTPMSAIISSQNGDSPVRNYKGIGYIDFPFSTAMKLRAKNYSAFGKKQYGCFSCPLRCGYILEYDKLPYKDKETHRPEYETIAAFGSMILNHDMDLLLQANEYMNRVGMDTISAGTVVAYAMEGVDEGVFKKGDFACKDYPDGFLPRFGDPAFVMPLLKLMVTREGIGDKLADGVWEAKSHFPGTEAFAINANGAEMGMHDLRLTKSWGMSYISDPTPGRHTAGNYDLGVMGMPDFFPEMKPMVALAEHPYQQSKSAAVPVQMHQVMESLGLCMFVYFFQDYHLLEMIEAATGWKMNANEVIAIGGRIQTTRQMFNAREGAIRHEIPQRAIGNPPMEKGPMAGNSLDLETMAQGYYEGMGFRQDGVPTPETLASYGLERMIPDLAISTGAPARLVNEYLYSDASAAKGKKKQKSQPVIGG